MVRPGSRFVERQRCVVSTGHARCQRVLFVGYSGGGAVMTYYQNVAEHGVAVGQKAARLDPCSNSLAGMPPADGVILLDAIMGIAFDRLTEMDGSEAATPEPRARGWPK
jgi:hypothetical protein